MLSSADWEDRIKLNSFEVRELKKGMEWVIYFKDNSIEFPCSRILLDDRYYSEVWIYLNESEWIKGEDLDVVILESKLHAVDKLIKLKENILKHPGLSRLIIIDGENPNEIFDTFYSKIVTVNAEKYFLNNK